jgi:hypothetical protein
MLARKTRNLLWVSVGLLLAAAQVSAAIEDAPCLLIGGVYAALQGIAPSIVAIMFIFGAAKYVYSADYPGGRKQGKTICIHAIIGAIIMALLVGIITIFGGLALCPGIAI